MFIFLINQGHHEPPEWGIIKKSEMWKDTDLPHVWENDMQTDPEADGSALLTE